MWDDGIKWRLNDDPKQHSPFLQHSHQKQQFIIIRFNVIKEKVKHEQEKSCILSIKCFIQPNSLSLSVVLFLLFIGWNQLQLTFCNILDELNLCWNGKRWIAFQVITQRSSITKIGHNRQWIGWQCDSTKHNLDSGDNCDFSREFVNWTNNTIRTRMKMTQWESQPSSLESYHIWMYWKISIYMKKEKRISIERMRENEFAEQ